MVNGLTDHRRSAISHQPLAMAVIALGLTMCAQPSVRTQARRPMSLIDIAELARIVDPQLSPDGKTLVYLLSHASWNADRPVYNLWRQDIGGGAPIRLSFGESGEVPGRTRWSPDGRQILLSRDAQLWLLPVDGGE